MKKRFQIRALLCAMLVASFSLYGKTANLPVSLGGYRYDCRHLLSELIRKNNWSYEAKTIAPELYKDFSVIYLGNLLKYEKSDKFWDSAEKRRHVLDYLNNGGVIIVNCRIPKELLGKDFAAEAPKFFGFGDMIRTSKVQGAAIGKSATLSAWQYGDGPAADKLAPETEVLAWYVMPDGKKYAAATRFKVGKGLVWWISPSLMRLTGAFKKANKTLGYPDDVGNYILTAEGNAVEKLKELYRQAFASSSKIQINKEGNSWGTKPLGSAGTLKTNSKFKKQPKLRSGFPKYAPGLVLCDSKVQAVIYPASEDVKKLASELKYHLDTMSGRNFVIVDKYPAKNINAIILGNGGEAKKFGVEPMHAKRDTVVIKRKGNHLFVGGSRNGASHALTVFLEALGCRYIWPGASGKIIPKRKTVVAPEMQMNSTVKLYMARSIRENSFDHGRYPRSLAKFGFKADEMIAMVKKLNHDAPDNRGFFQWHGFNDDPMLLGWEKKPEQIYEWGHAYGHLYRKYGKQHPEYFALQPDGSRKQPPRPRLCHSNKDLPKVIAAEKVEVFKKYPHKQAVSICLNDGGFSSMCLCEECRKLDPVNAGKANILLFVPKRRLLEYVSLADRILYFSNQVAEEVLKQVPGKQFCLYAYSTYVEPPVKVKPHPSLIIFSVAGGYSSEENRQKALVSIARWSSFGNPMLWRPNALFGFRHQLMPQNFARKIFNDLELFKANNIIGDDIDCFEMLWAFKGLPYYALSKAQLNYHEVDYDTIFNDYCESGFGKAAPEIKKYFLLLEKLTDECAKTRCNYFDLVTEPVLKELQGYLARAKAIAKDDAAIMERINFLDDALTMGAMHRQLHFAKDRTTAEYKAMQSALKNKIHDVTAKNPFAVNPFKMGLYLPYL